MSKLNALRQKQQALEVLKAELAALEESKEVQEDLAFLKDAQALLEKYGKTPLEFAEAFELEVNAPRVRAERKVRTFKNPKTGETLEAKSTNNKTLRAWAVEAGVDVADLEVK